MIALALAAAAAAQGLPPGPVDFSARDLRMETQAKSRVLHLDGDVKLNRGDLFLTGDRAVADLAQTKAKEKPAVDRFTIDGNVHAKRGERTADGQHGVYDVPAQTLLLTGDDARLPVVREGSDQLAGESILLHTDSDDVEVQKPRLVLHRSIPQQPGAKAEATPEALKVDADHLMLHHAARLAKFTDAVVVRRADMVARSPRMDARYDASGQLTTLQMKGGVDVRQRDRRATGQTADYDARTHHVVLLGDPKIYDRGDVLTGDRIELSLDTSEVHVERGKAHLRPELHKNEGGAQ